MKVRTTRKTFDPYIIIKARDMLKLLSRSVPANQVSYLPHSSDRFFLKALKIFQDENSCDVIKISGFTSNQVRHSLIYVLIWMTGAIEETQTKIDWTKRIDIKGT